MATVSWAAVGAVLCAVSVAAGAFGAHALGARLEPRSLELWETGFRYLMFAGLALLASGWLRDGAPILPGVLLSLGGIVFGGTLAALALGGPRWLGAITPLGGLLLIAGFLALARAALR